ncbi:hypothetical protein R1sor_009077 [Riccia sorocarpa]|uniref:Uncharacterized protein n=1 Tax=Riccia sorocarpa TaxID=122646 RepID=A0ABD3H4Z2_9MARC
MLRRLMSDEIKEGVKRRLEEFLVNLYQGVEESGRSAAREILWPGGMGPLCHYVGNMFNLRNPLELLTRNLERAGLLHFVPREYFSRGDEEALQDILDEGNVVENLDTGAGTSAADEQTVELGTLEADPVDAPERSKHRTQEKSTQPAKRQKVVSATDT